MKINLDELNKVWVEDDITPGMIDHEGLTSAWMRLYNEDYNEACKLVEIIEDGGDYKILRWSDGRTVYSSWPGTNKIFQPIGYSDQQPLGVQNESTIC